MTDNTNVNETEPENDSSRTTETEQAPSATQVTCQTGNDERGTPTTFIRKLHNAIGDMFDLDPCSGAEPQPIARTRFTKEMNGLAQSWSGFETVYVNPPYSDLARWLKKIHREVSRDDDPPELVMCLLPGNTSTQWFQRHATKAEYLCLIEGRLTFNGTDQSAPFASILVVYGDPSQDVLETLETLGATYTKAEITEGTTQTRLDEMLQNDGGGVIPAGPPATNPATDSPESPGTIPGPTVLDLSDQAPAVPQGVIDFYNIAIGDDFFIKFDDATLGFPNTIPTEGYITVLSGEPAGDHHTQTPDDWHTITCIHEPTDTWVVLCQDPHDMRDIRCSVSPHGNGWIDVDLDRLHRLTCHTKAAIEPYGPGTSYVC